MVRHQGLEPRTHVFIDRVRMGNSDTVSTVRVQVPGASRIEHGMELRPHEIDDLTHAFIQKLENRVADISASVERLEADIEYDRNELASARSTFGIECKDVAYLATLERDLKELNARLAGENPDIPEAEHAILPSFDDTPTEDDATAHEDKPADPMRLENKVIIMNGDGGRAGVSKPWTTPATELVVVDRGEESEHVTEPKADGAAVQ